MQRLDLRSVVVGGHEHFVAGTQTETLKPAVQTVTSTCEHSMVLLLQRERQVTARALEMRRER
jgi:hypothetical protein